MLSGLAGSVMCFAVQREAQRGHHRSGDRTGMSTHQPAGRSPIGERIILSGEGLFQQHRCGRSFTGVEVSFWLVYDSQGRHTYGIHPRQGNR